MGNKGNCKQIENREEYCYRGEHKGTPHRWKNLHFENPNETHEVCTKCGLERRSLYKEKKLKCGKVTRSIVKYQYRWWNPFRNLNRDLGDGMEAVC